LVHISSFLSFHDCTPEILFVIISSSSSSFSNSSFLSLPFYFLISSSFLPYLFLFSSLSLPLLFPPSLIPHSVRFFYCYCFLFLFCSFSLSPLFSFFNSFSAYSLTCPKPFAYSSPQTLPLLRNFLLFAPPLSPPSFLSRLSHLPI
jgi:hypothetical protein